MAEVWDYDDDVLAGQTQLVGDDDYDAGFLSIGDVIGFADPTASTNGLHAHGASDSGLRAKRTTENQSPAVIVVKPTPEAAIEAPGEPLKRSCSTSTSPFQSLGSVQLQSTQGSGGYVTAESQIPGEETQREALGIVSRLLGSESQLLPNLSLLPGLGLGLEPCVGDAEPGTGRRAGDIDGNGGIRGFLTRCGDDKNMREEVQGNAAATKQLMLGGDEGDKGQQEGEDGSGGGGTVEKKDEPLARGIEERMEPPSTRKRGRGGSATKYQRSKAQVRREAEEERKQDEEEEKVEEEKEEGEGEIIAGKRRVSGRKGGGISVDEKMKQQQATSTRGRRNKEQRGGGRGRGRGRGQKKDLAPAVKPGDTWAHGEAATGGADADGQEGGEETVVLSDKRLPEAAISGQRDAGSEHDSGMEGFGVTAIMGEEYEAGGLRLGESCPPDVVLTQDMEGEGGLTAGELMDAMGSEADVDNEGDDDVAGAVEHTSEEARGAEQVVAGAGIVGVQVGKLTQREGGAAVIASQTRGWQSQRGVAVPLKESEDEGDAARPGLFSPPGEDTQIALEAMHGLMGEDEGGVEEGGEEAGEFPAAARSEDLAAAGGSISGIVAADGAGGGAGGGKSGGKQRGQQGEEAVIDVGADVGMDGGHTGGGSGSSSSSSGAVVRRCSVVRMSQLGRGTGLTCIPSTVSPAKQTPGGHRAEAQAEAVWQAAAELRSGKGREDRDEHERMAATPPPPPPAIPPATAPPLPPPVVAAAAVDEGTGGGEAQGEAKGAVTTPTATVHGAGSGDGEGREWEREREGECLSSGAGSEHRLKKGERVCAGNDDEGRELMSSLEPLAAPTGGERSNEKKGRGGKRSSAKSRVRRIPADLTSAHGPLLPAPTAVVGDSRERDDAEGVNRQHPEPPTHPAPVASGADQPAAQAADGPPASDEMIDVGGMMAAGRMIASDVTPRAARTPRRRVSDSLPVHSDGLAAAADAAGTGSVRRGRPHAGQLGANKAQGPSPGPRDHKRLRSDSETPPLERKRTRSKAPDTSTGRAADTAKGSRVTINSSRKSGRMVARTSPQQVVTRSSTSPGLPSPPLLSPRAGQRAAEGSERGRRKSPVKKGGSGGKNKRASPSSSSSSGGSGDNKRVSSRPARNAGSLAARQRGVYQGSAEGDGRGSRRVAVLFSRSLDETLTAKLTKIIHQLGGRVVSSPHRCSHFVAEKFVRTVNLLVAVARGCHVATPDWLLTSREAKSFVDASSFPLQDCDKEREMDFDLQSAVGGARRQPLLQGWHVLITPHTRPDLTSLAAMVSAAGAKVVKKVTIDDNLDTTLVISCEEDEAMCQPWRAHGLKIRTPEFVMMSILRHNLDFTRWMPSLGC